jgi:hypothetical protein
MGNSDSVIFDRKPLLVDQRSGDVACAHRGGDPSETTKVFSKSTLAGTPSTRRDEATGVFEDLGLGRALRSRFLLGGCHALCLHFEKGTQI